MQAELTGRLGYEKGDPEAELYANSCNGSSAKTDATSVGDVELAIPRDRDGSFTPALVPKGSRRVGGLDDMIVSLYAGGMTVRDIEHHLVSTVGTEISRETISKITDEVLDEVMAWPMIGTLPEHLRGSLTWDQGSEMAAHKQFSIATDVPVYFCYPHSPWQRGSNENTNGLLRQYFRLVLI